MLRVDYIEMDLMLSWISFDLILHEINRLLEIQGSIMDVDSIIILELGLR